MSAALAATAGPADQASLPGIAPPPAASQGAPDVHALKVGLLGILAAPPIVREVTRQHRPGVQLEVLVSQAVAHHPHATPVLAVLPCPDQADYAATHRAAREHAAHLSAGGEVIVLGQGLEPARHGGASVLRLIHTDAIHRADEVAGSAGATPPGDRLAH